MRTAGEHSPLGEGSLYDCGQSYKHFTLVNYDSRVEPDLKILYIAVAVDLNTRQIEAIPCTYEAYLPTSQLKFLGFPPFM